MNSLTEKMERNEEFLMLNLEKVKLMNHLAMYENNAGKTYLPISKFYRSDYIGMALIKNFFLVTIGYLLLVAVIFAYFAEFLLNSIHKMNLVTLGAELIIGYLVVLAVYTVLTYVQYSVRYHRAKKSVKQYYIQLTKLERMYGKNEKKNGDRRTSRRK